MTNQHWYQSDGTPRHGLTLREARKENLLPSVSAILSIWPQEGLKRWLRSMDILSAYTTPRLPTESDEQWTERVIACADEDSKRARDTGTRRHAIIEQFNKDQLKFGQWEPLDLAFCDGYFTWFKENVIKVYYTERIVVNREMGYAGTLDLDCFLRAGEPSAGAGAVVDIKNRKKLGVYDTDCMQLVAYSRCEGCRADKLISIVLGTERQEILVREWTAEEIDRAWKNFKLCLELWCASRDYYPTKGAQ